MSLARHAAYLYLYARKLQKLTAKIQDLSKEAQSHIQKHNATTDQSTREKYKHKHYKTTKELQNLIKKHNELLGWIHHHEASFSYALQKEHKINFK